MRDKCAVHKTNSAWGNLKRHSDRGLRVKQTLIGRNNAHAGQTSPLIRGLITWQELIAGATNRNRCRELRRGPNSRNPG